MTTYAQVVRVLGPERDGVLADFRARGGNADRWGPRDREAMVEALIRGEDRLEMAGSRKAVNMACRGALKAIRRVLEAGAYP